MERRKFNKLTGTLGTLAIVNPASLFFQKQNPLDRIGISTVNFRNRFASTNPNSSMSNRLTLLQVPQYFSDRFSIKNVEFWSRHFESTEKDYLRKLKKALKKNESRLINIQMDEKYQIGDPDLQKRKESVELVLHWVEVAYALEAECIRVNPGKGKLQYAIESYRAINGLAKKKGILLLIENHFGMAMDPEIHLKIVREVGANVYTLPDFGNYEDNVRFDALKKIIPKAHQISAKTVDFDQNGNHVSFDFDRCMKIAIDSGFKGIYSLEQWSRNDNQMNDEEMADWMIAHIKSALVNHQK